MTDLKTRIVAAAAFPLLPVLLVQGKGVRRRTPRLPDAAGPVEGFVPGAGEPLRLLVLGESTVAGIGAAAHEQALTGRVAAALAERTERAVRWRAAGRSGANAREAAGLVATLPDERADAVVISLGVNDTLRFRPPALWARDVARLVEAVRARAGPAPVVLAPVPPMHAFPALPQPLRAILGARARRLDAALARLAARLPTTAHVALWVEPAPGLFCEDGFHPSEAGYTVIGEHLAAGLARLIEGR
ncbi:SGNH/GDSL hydrolase family protein [Longimicrobium sp.]|uniref:SGNH/GDSL hydrolase family protein n=1 Tax=Longimicrobium sp. TaxID=2029185 RepID=UPI002D127BE2|nr:SGNH/GDSL hydrolase family protein [Longimicrobium sp.]HSU15872.1 SGNH/GDSL hydrolase family protein [Longimicrobium sp.]